VSFSCSANDVDEEVRNTYEYPRYDNG
jgi:hypothetical protein